MLFKAALTLTEQGFRVFPCMTGQKRPLTKHGLRDASMDKDALADWWSRWPDANVGIATGPTTGYGEPGLIILDIDVKNGIDGMFSLRGLEVLYGKLPDSPEARTPSGGVHLYFKLHEGGPYVDIPCSVGKLAPGVDVRARGGLVIAPPSTVGNERYEWTREPVSAHHMPLLPKAWLAALKGTSRPRTPRPAVPVAVDLRRRLSGVLDRLLGAQEGERNSLLHWASWRFREEHENGRITEAQAVNALLTAADHLGLPRPEAEATVFGVFRRTDAA